MPRGLALPVRVAPWGGVALIEGDDNDHKIISLALGSDDSENAFQQDIGLGEAMIFDVSDPQLRGRIVAKIRNIFRRFEVQKRYRLLGETMRWQPGEPGELVLEFKYINLESDETKTFSRSYRGSGA
ncbi:MAG: hypothetical protein AB7W59_00100 [Acidimicrobiia bacterium]